MADWSSLAGPTLMGRLTATPDRGKEVFAFKYDEAWLSSASRLALDPSLSLYRGPQYPAKQRENFGLFLESCPDRWGRVLMRRREAQLARAEVGEAVREWRVVASSHGLPRAAQERMRRAFRVAQR